MSMDSGSDLFSRLEEHATPNANDIRHKSYVDYVNCFLSYFGKERAYLVGSTCEKLKLRWSYEGGDADFLLCSGILEIPVGCIEPRPDIPCYVWVRADNFDSDICPTLVIGNYLSADTVKEVRPEIFTILRAVYTHVTTTSDGMPGDHSRVTVAGVSSNVGLQLTQYRNLKAAAIPETKGSRRLGIKRSAQVTAQLQRRWSGVELHVSDTNTLQRIFRILAMLKVPGSKGEMFGKFNNFTQLLSEVLKRPAVNHCAEQEPPDEVTMFDNDLDEDKKPDTKEKFKATFSEKTSKDFVPAVRIVGERKLECMDTWRKRVEHLEWPGNDLADEVYHTDIFLVARNAPLNPDSQNRDFCLSFNLAEMKLSQKMSVAQRRVFLILKSYLKGFIEKKHKEKDIDIKLKTYHLKTAFFWVCERQNASTWTDDYILNGVDNCLTFLLQCMEQRTLSHYFLESNLLINFTGLDFEVLTACIEEILLNKMKYIEYFFEQNMINVGEVLLTKDEVMCIQQMYEDGGRMQHMDKLEDQLIDLQRGFNACQRDRFGQAPIKDAVLAVIDHFLQEEREKKLRKSQDNKQNNEAADTLQKQSGCVPTGQSAKKEIVAGILNTLLTGSGSGAVSSQRHSETTSSLFGLASMIPGGSEFVDSLGGREGINVILKRTVDPNADLGSELRSKIDRYLSSEEADVESLAQELKHELIAFFIRAKGKDFFDD